MAAHKGFGLAMFVEIITAMATGGAFLTGVSSWIKEVKEPINQSHAFLAIDVGAMVPIESFKRRVDDMVREFRNSPKAKGVHRIYVPGEMEWERRDKVLAEGCITLPDHVVENLIGVAKDYDMDTADLFES